MEDFSELIASCHRLITDFTALTESIRSLPREPVQFLAATKEIRLALDEQIARCQDLRQKLPPLNYAQKMLMLHPDGMAVWGQYQFVYFSMHSLEDYMQLHRFMIAVEQYPQAPSIFDKYIDAATKAELNAHLRRLTQARARLREVGRICRWDWAGVVLAFAVMLAGSFLPLPWVGWSVGALVGLGTVYGSIAWQRGTRDRYNRALRTVLTSFEQPLVVSFRAIREAMPTVDAGGQIRFPPA